MQKFTFQNEVQLMGSLLFILNFHVHFPWANTYFWCVLQLQMELEHIFTCFRSLLVAIFAAICVAIFASIFVAIFGFRFWSLLHIRILVLTFCHLLFEFRFKLQKEKKKTHQDIFPLLLSGEADLYPYPEPPCGPCDTDRTYKRTGFDPLFQSLTDQPVHPDRIHRGVFLFDVVLYGYVRNPFARVQRFQRLFDHDDCGWMSWNFTRRRSIYTANVNVSAFV